MLESSRGGLVCIHQLSHSVDRWAGHTVDQILLVDIMMDSMNQKWSRSLYP